MSIGKSRKGFFPHRSVTTSQSLTKRFWLSEMGPCSRSRYHKSLKQIYMKLLVLSETTKLYPTPFENGVLQCIPNFMIWCFRQETVNKWAYQVPCLFDVSDSAFSLYLSLGGTHKQLNVNAICKTRCNFNPMLHQHLCLQ